MDVSHEDTWQVALVGTQGNSMSWPAHRPLLAILVPLWPQDNLPDG